MDEQMTDRYMSEWMVGGCVDGQVEEQITEQYE